MNMITDSSAIVSKKRTKTDLRVIKTKRAINAALVDLLQKKSIDKISVAELARNAEINKGTFYLHYTDIYDLYQNALNEHLVKIVDELVFMNQIFTDPDLFTNNLVTLSLKNAIFENDPFLAKQNSRFNQSAHSFFCNALVSKVVSFDQIPASEENLIKLQFIFSGAGSLMRYDSHRDIDLLIKVISDTIKNLFPEFKHSSK